MRSDTIFFIGTALNRAMSKVFASRTGVLMLQSMRSRAAAEISEATATLSVYTENPAGIGDHHKVIKEAQRQVDRIAAAYDTLNVLNKIEAVENLS